MPEFGATKLNNVSNLPIEPVFFDDGINSLYLILDICPLLHPEPFSNFLTTLVQNCFPSVFFIIRGDGRVSNLNFAHSCKFEGPVILDLFEVWADLSLRQHVLQRNSYLLSKVQVVDLCRHKTRTVSVLHKKYDSVE